MCQIYNKNNEIEQISKEINSLQYLLKKNEKSLNQFKNGLIQIGRLRVKEGKSMDLFQTKKKEIQLGIYSKIR